MDYKNDWCESSDESGPDVDDYYVGTVKPYMFEPVTSPQNADSSEPGPSASHPYFSRAAMADASSW